MNATMGVLPATAVKRVPTGLDQGARKAALRALREADISPEQLLDGLLRHGAYGGIDDYLAAVKDVWGEEVEYGMGLRVGRFVSARGDDSRLDQDAADQETLQRYGPLGVLLMMPEPDFLTAVETCLFGSGNPLRALQLPREINRIFELRGVPYRVRGFGSGAHFEWTGDAVVQEEVLTPMLSALEHPLLSDGPCREFEQARRELRVGTPDAHKQAVSEACNAVESTLKVVLEAHGVGYSKSAGLGELWSAAGHLVPPHMRSIVTAAGHVGNQRGRHGGGRFAHAVQHDEAAAVVAQAAVAITYLVGCLPTEGT